MRPSCYRTHEEKLLQAEIAVENIAFGQSVSALEIERRQHLAGDDRARNVGRIFGDFLDHAIAQQFAFSSQLPSRR